MSAPEAAAPEIALDIAASVVPLTVCSAARAAGAPGVPAAAAVAATAVLMAMSAAVFADWSAATAASGIPLHAGKNPINTFRLPGPGTSTGGSGWATLSVILAAGPCGIALVQIGPFQFVTIQTVRSDRFAVVCFSKNRLEFSKECL